MKLIKIFPIHSSLHDNNIIKEQTNSLLKKLSNSNFNFLIENNIDNLYKNCDLVLILIQSGGSENTFLNFIGKLKPPFYLLTYGTNNSLAASLEILSYLKNNNLDGQILHGDSQYLISALNNLLINNDGHIVNLGVIGKPSDWLISCNVNYQTILDKFKIKLVDISIDEIVEQYNHINNINIDKKFIDDGFDIKEINKAIRLYQALKNIVEKYDLKGFTIRCFDLLYKIKTTACLALSMFNDENIIATCEGDIPAMISMYIVNKVLNKNSFQANPSKIDIKNNKILLAHCTIGLKMCSCFKLDTHFESNIGIGIHGDVKLGDVTIFRLNSTFNKCFIEEGSLIKNQYEDNLCRTQIICTFPNLEKLLTNPLGNHQIIILGHHKKQLVEYLKNKGINEI